MPIVCCPPLLSARRAELHILSSRSLALVPSLPGISTTNGYMPSAVCPSVLAHWVSLRCSAIWAARPAIVHDPWAIAEALPGCVAETSMLKVLGPMRSRMTAYFLSPVAGLVVGCSICTSFHCSTVSDRVFECVCDYVPNPAVSLVAFVRCFGTGECVKVVSDRANVSMPTLALPRSVLGECVEDGEQKT